MKIDYLIVLCKVSLSFQIIIQKTSYFLQKNNEEMCHLTVLDYVSLSVYALRLLLLLLLLLIIIGTTLYMYRDVIEAPVLI